MLARFNLRLVCHTTEDVSHIGRVQELVERLLGVFEQTNLRVNWDEPPDFVHGRTALYRSLSEAKLAAIYALGGIALSDPDDRKVRASIEWHKIRIKDADSFISTRGCVQNQVSVHADARLLDDPAFKSRYLDLVRQLAVGFNVSLLYVYDPTYWDARYSGKWGLGVGLRDLYWVTVFGAPYVEIVGRDRLLGCPVMEVEELTSEQIIYIRVADAFCEPNHPSVLSFYQKARDCIGSRFFAKCHLDRAPELPSSGSLLNPLRLFQLRRFLSEAKQQSDDSTVKADICPTFDWKNIFARW